MALRYILEPIRIRGLEVKNRIVRTAHGTFYRDINGLVAPDLIAFHEARARGGVGLTFVESTIVHPSSGDQVLHTWKDEVIPGFRLLGNAVHKHGMKMFVQLNHGGFEWPAYNGQTRIGASDVPSPYAGVPPMPYGGVPLAMTHEQIEMLTDAFAAAAVRCQEAGLDGVEVHFGHGYLVQQFLSPGSNRRADGYGGSLENRMRFGVEILQRIRKRVGDFPIGIRISDQHALGGLTVSEASQVVAVLCKMKLIDLVSASMGSHNDVPSMVPAMDQPTGSMLPSSGPIAAAADVPRIVVGRYRNLEDAESVIRDGIADMVALTRAHIADPDLVRKTLAGHTQDIRPCIGCNQGCVGGQTEPGGKVYCTVNPVVDKGSWLSEDLIGLVEHPRKFVIVGGGPAGMEAARVAALHGHKVVLFEAQPQLGGAINIAAQAPNLHELASILPWLERQIRRLGVDVRPSTVVDRTKVLAESPDVVLVATGSKPRLDCRSAAAPGYLVPGFDLSHVYSSHAIFSVSKSFLGRSAVVFDDVGHYEAIAVAEHLISLGVRVVYVSRFNGFAPTVANFLRTAPALDRLYKGAFSLRISAQLLEIQPGLVKIGYINTSASETLDCDTLVAVTFNKSERGIYDQLQDIAGVETALIGDALTPRDLRFAMEDGHLITRRLAQIGERTRQPAQAYATE